MLSPYLLDTNAYALFLQHPKTLACSRLEQRLDNGNISFYISEVTSMEIHSVLGKYRRGSPRQFQLCDRQTVGKDPSKCIWIHPGRKPLRVKLFRDLQKLIYDIESMIGKIQASVIPLDQDTITEAKRLLRTYSDHYSVGSHDALIGAVARRQNEANGLQLTVVTADKGLKALLSDEHIPVYDPNNP